MTHVPVFQPNNSNSTSLSAVLSQPYSFPNKVSSIGLCNTEALDLLEAATALVNYNHTDGTSPVFLLAWEHGAKVSKNPESPKSPGKIPCLSGFQAGHTLGNVKIAEVRSNDAALGIDTASPASGLVITSAVRWRAYGEN